MMNGHKPAAIFVLILIFLTAASCSGGKASSGSSSAPSLPTAAAAPSLSAVPDVGAKPSVSVSPAVTAAPSASVSPAAAESPATAPSEAAVTASLLREYQNVKPTQWDIVVKGVKTRLDTTDKVVALTFDACGGKGGDGYDKELIDYLIKQNVPATLFINSRWIDENRDAFLSLSKNTLFEIENHGSEHKPLSVDGKSAYDISGTKNAQGVIDEVQPNADKIYKLTGRKPLFFRSGTDYYDDVAVRIVVGLGEQAVAFSLLGDAGATYSTAEIKNACLAAKPGDIIIFHMNHPEKDTAEGIMEVVPALRAKGFAFVHLADYPLI